MNKRKTLRIVLAITLAVVIAAGATLAYLTARTPTINNVFTFSSNVSGVIEEPGWDDQVWDQTLNGGNGGFRPRGNPSDQWGRNRATNIVPGREIPKDPNLVNSGSIAVYGALRVEFVNGGGGALTAPQLAAVMTNVNIDWNTTAWTLVSGARNTASHIVHYNNVIAQNARGSAPYFTTVTISPTTSTADMATLQGIPGGFNIRINGAVIQAEGFTNAAAAAPQLVTLFTTP